MLPNISRYLLCSTSRQARAGTGAEGFDAVGGVAAYASDEGGSSGVVIVPVIGRAGSAVATGARADSVGPGCVGATTGGGGGVKGGKVSGKYFATGI